MGDGATCGSQPEGNTAHKSTSGPIHLSVIASSGNTDTIMQRLQGMLYPGLFFFFSLSVRDFSSQQPPLHPEHTHTHTPPTQRHFKWTPEDGERMVRQVKTNHMLGHGADVQSMTRTASLRDTHAHTLFTFGVLGENMIFLVICANNVPTALEHSTAGQKSVFAVCWNPEEATASVHLCFQMTIDWSSSQGI